MLLGKKAVGGIGLGVERPYAVQFFENHPGQNVIGGEGVDGMGLLGGLELTDRLVVFQVVKGVETLPRGRVVVRTRGDKSRCSLGQATAGHRNAAQNQEAKVQSVRFHHRWLLRSLPDMASRKKELQMVQALLVAPHDKSRPSLAIARSHSVIDRPAAFSYRVGGSDCVANVLLRCPDGLRQRVSPRQLAGQGRGAGAPRPVS